MDIRFKYFLKNFQLFYDAVEGDVGYPPDENAPVTVEKRADDSFWTSGRDIDLSQVIWKEWKGTRIPFLFDKDQTRDIVTYRENSAVINYDVVASGFYFLSGWNEVMSGEKDIYGRPLSEKSAVGRLSLYDIPVVNYYFDIVYEAVRHVKQKNIKKYPWGGRKFAVALTHDIDNCRSAWLEGSMSELKRGRLLSVPRLIARHFLKGQDAWFNFDEISRIEKQYQASSSFYFLPRKGRTGNMKNADYNIDDKRLRRTIELLRGEGHEIGIHGSVGTHTDAGKLKTEMPESVSGNRFHYLLFDSVKSVSVLEECGIKYDTSLGFPDHTGFRRATCYPFYLFNFERNDISPVLEIPLTAMDASMAQKKYMGLKHQDALNITFKLIDEVKKHEGVFTILWHNTYFSGYKYEGWRDVYIRVLDYCRENNALLTNAKVIYDRICGKA